MKKILKKVLFILYETLMLPIVALYIPYFKWIKRKKIIKSIDTFYNFLEKIENKF